MNIADRIQYLRKTRGISQEELADKLGVSRQAVSKWESEQSIPDLERVIMMSDFFSVTTDYILKGIENQNPKEYKEKELASLILFIASTAFVVIGLLVCIGEWNEKQTMEVVFGSMIIQVLGIVAYFIGRALSARKPSFYVIWLNEIGVAFMPASMLSACISKLIFKTGMLVPYPIDIFHTAVFCVMYLAICILSFLYTKRSYKH